MLGPERRWDLDRFEHLDEIGAREEGSEPCGRIADRSRWNARVRVPRWDPQAERRRGRRKEVDPVRLEGRELVAPRFERGMEQQNQQSAVQRYPERQ